MVDSTLVRAHRAAAGGKRGVQSQAIGRSRGGRTTRIHAVADEQGRIAAVLLTPGQASDISGAR
ncbi:transposase, partial [Acidiphilium sp.]|uniref:transposase n=1 Tax=Acidiphilium sp. TaxID=527 RepID=UPI00338E9F60